MTKRARAAWAAVATLTLASCAGAPSDDGVLAVYATTGYLADAVSVIAPGARVTTMVGPGSDPHTYQPSTRDIQRIQGADLVVWNGLHLEAQMTDLMDSLGDRALAVGSLLDTDQLLAWPDGGSAGEPLYDPHIWNSPELWSQVVEHLAQELGEVDPPNAQAYTGNADAYRQQIADAAVAAQEALARIPADARTLITGHDAFAYFGDRFDLEVHATDFISTEAQLSPQELSGLADLVVERSVPVIFADNQANPQAIRSLQEAVAARGWQVQISETELYADSLGAEPGVDTYLGVLEHNVAAIVAGLAGRT